MFQVMRHDYNCFYHTFKSLGVLNPYVHFTFSKLPTLLHSHLNLSLSRMYFPFILIVQPNTLDPTQSTPNYHIFVVSHIPTPLYFNLTASQHAFLCTIFRNIQIKIQFLIKQLSFFAICKHIF